MTNDGLTAFKRVGGSDGAQVVPDLATSLPTPTDGGLTYTFQLRPGSATQTAASQARRLPAALERCSSSGSACYYRKFVGGAACVAHPAGCDLSRGIVTDDASEHGHFSPRHS